MTHQLHTEIEIDPAPEMASWNLATRFALELVALGGLGFAGWKLGDGALGWILALGVPIAAAVIWSTLNVPDDPSRSGRAPVEVDGWIRLTLELIVLGSGAAALWYVGRPALALGYALVVVAQYATSLDRVRWLVHH